MVHYLNEGFDFNQAEIQDDSGISGIDVLKLIIFQDIEKYTAYLKQDSQVNLDIQYINGQLNINFYSNQTKRFYSVFKIEYIENNQILNIHCDIAWVKGNNYIIQLLNELYSNNRSVIKKIYLFFKNNNIKALGYFYMLKYEILEYVDIQFYPNIRIYITGTLGDIYEYNQEKVDKGIEILKWICRNISEYEMQMLIVSIATFYNYYNSGNKKHLSDNGVRNLILKLWKETH